MSLPLMFALAFPVEAPPGESVFAIEIPAEAYATVTRPDLRDIAVVDANGVAQTISLMQPAPPRLAPPAAIALPEPIAVPAGIPGRNERFDLHITRDETGRLTRLDLGSGDAAADGGNREWLLDAGPAAADGYSGLRVALAEDAGDFRTLLTVRGSDDLVEWTEVATALPLLRVSADGQRIERLDLRFAPVNFRYLGLGVAPGAPPLPPPASLSALREAETSDDAERALRLTGRPTRDAAGREGLGFEYSSPGPLPVTRIGVRLTETNAVREFTLTQQSGDVELEVMSGTAWQFDVRGLSLDPPDRDVDLPGVGPLRLELRQSAATPDLVFHYVPARVVVVASGPPPYRLLAGSGRHRAEFVPMDDALAGLRAARGMAWMPPVVKAGPGTTLGGPAALAAVQPVDRGRLALWAVLGLGAVLVGGLAWRALKGGAASTG